MLQQSSLASGMHSTNVAQAASTSTSITTSKAEITPGHEPCFCELFHNYMGGPSAPRLGNTRALGRAGTSKHSTFVHQHRAINSHGHTPPAKLLLGSISSPVSG